ncbi:MAG: glycosyltransferase family 39 protein [bacterium]|nr:glycosyltransferase family 39 protein [bacterium]
MSANKSRLLVIILILAVQLAALVYFLSVNGSAFFNPARNKMQGDDQSEFWRLAVNIVDNRVFSLSKTTPYAPDQTRTPIFPLFIGLGYGISGGFMLPIVLNILVSILTVFLVFEGALYFSKNKNIALFTAVAYIFLFYRLYAPNLFLADTLFNFLFTLFIFYFLKNLLDQDEISYKKSAFSGFLLGLVTLTRPITQYFILIPVLCLVLKNKKLSKKSFVSIGIFVLIFLTILSPWFIRNYVLFNRVFLSSIGDYHTFVSYVGPWQSYKENISRMEGAERIKKYVEEKYGAMAMYDIEKSRALANEAKGKILEAPLSYAFFHLSSVPIFFLNNDIILGLRHAFKISLPDVFAAEKVLTGNFSAIFDIVRKFNPAVLFLFFGSYAFIFLKSVLGIGVAVYLSRKGELKAFFCLATIFYFALIVGFEGQARFRLPIESFLLFFSVMGIYSGYNFFKSKSLLKSENAKK